MTSFKILLSLILLLFSNICDCKCMARTGKKDEDCSKHKGWKECTKDDENCLWNPNGVNFQTPFVKSITLSKKYKESKEKKKKVDASRTSDNKEDKISAKEYIDSITLISVCLTYFHIIY